jgi:hypothetical protein
MASLPIYGMSSHMGGLPIYGKASHLEKFGSTYRRSSQICELFPYGNIPMYGTTDFPCTESLPIYGKTSETYGRMSDMFVDRFGGRMRQILIDMHKLI